MEYVTLPVYMLNEIARRSNELGHNETRVRGVVYVPPQTTSQDPNGSVAWELDGGPASPSEPWKVG